jgi:glycosyltransferase involved in cell wall biosynthesis
MKIAHIVASLEARHGGPSRSVLGLATVLAQTGHVVDLLTTAPTPTAAPMITGNLTVQTFHREWPQLLSPSMPLRAHLRASSPELVHHHGLWLRPLHYARAAAAKSGVPLVISPRGMMAPWAWQNRRWKKFLASHLVHPGALAAAHGWHATSEAEAEHIRRLGFRQPICIAPNGVVAPSAAERAAAKEFWRQQCPELLRRPAALFYSRFHPMKRVIEQIDLWLQHAPKDWLLLFVGIPEEFSVEQLRGYVYRSSGQNRVAVFDGTHVPPPYSVAELLLLPSHTENFGLVVAEALAHGLPVLATDTTPWASLEGSGAGRCVPWSQFGPTLAALLAENAEQRDTRRAAARILAATELGWAKSAATLAAFYENLRARPA